MQNSLVPKGFYNKNHFLGLKERKITGSQKDDFNKGYNLALKKCNRRAQRIISEMFEAYQRSVQDEDEDDEYDY